MGVVWSGVLPYAVGLALAVAVVRTRTLRQREPGLALRQRLGLLLLTTPLFTLLGVGLASIPSLMEASTTAAAAPDVLASKAVLHLAGYLALPAVGLALVLGRRFPEVARRALSPSGRDGLASGLRVTGLATAGLAGPVIAAWALAGGDGGLLAADGAGLFFSRTTPIVALALSGTAALAEEILFRGVALRWLEEHTTTVAAIGIQALAFGLIHAGYGSILHVVAATAFGVLMAALARRHGLAPAIATHLLVNLVILGLWSGHRILLGLAALAVVVALVVGQGLATSQETSTPPEPAPARG